MCLAPHVLLDAPGPAETGDGGADAVNMMAVETGQNVVEYGAVAKQLDLLKGPPNAPRGNNVSGKRGDVFAAEHDCAGVRPDDAGDGVDQRRLARAVRPDQAANFAGFHFNSDAAHRGDPAKADRD